MFDITYTTLLHRQLYLLSYSDHIEENARDQFTIGYYLPDMRS